MIAVVTVSLLLLLGVALRAILTPIARARIPASVVAGLLGCGIAQLLLALGSEWTGIRVRSVLGEFGSWGDVLISLVFAGLLLAPEGELRARSRDVWLQGIVAWIIILGQLALGLFASALLIRPFFDVPAPFGQYIEVTMAGGFGSANAMATLLSGERYHFAPARDLLVFGATAGLLWGVVSGIVLARLGQSLGWTSKVPSDESSGQKSSAAAQGESEARSSSLDSILFQFCLLAIALGIGLAMQFAVKWIAGRFDGVLHTPDHRYETSFGNLPLFFFALVGGWLLRIALKGVGLSRVLDRKMIHRLCGIAMDVLIVASLARMSFAKVADYFWPVTLMLALGSIWSAFCLIWLSPRILPRRYWFELGLINYGFSTAATAQGMMFLRIVDPKLKSGAAETYALGAPLTAPFIGGGMITFLVLPPVIDKFGSTMVGGIAGALMIVLFIVGLRLRTTSETFGN